MTISIILLSIFAAISLTVAILYIVWTFKNKTFSKRQYIDKKKEVFGTNNKGCSLDEHETLVFYSPDDMGL